MKKTILFILIIVAAMTSLYAKDDPFATKRFISKNFEVSFRFQDEKGVPVVRVKENENTNNYYYDFDSENLAFYYSDGSCANIYQYSFIKDGQAIRLFKEDGSFIDLDSDNGKSTVDNILDSTETVLGNTLLYGFSGAALGALGGTYGATIGFIAGGIVGIGKSLIFDVF